MSRPPQPDSVSRRQQSVLKVFKPLQRAAFIALIFLRLISTEAHADISSNLRVHYPFTAGTGNDVSGNNLNATLANITVTSGPSGIFADAALFNGTNSTAVVGATVAMSNQQTYAVWIKPTAFGDYRPIIDKADPGFAGEIDCELRIRPDGKIDWYVSTIGGSHGILISTTSNSSITLNLWTYVAAVIDRSNDQIRLYINGILETSVSMAGRDVRNNNRTLRIGSKDSNQAIRYFQGAIDEVRIYDRSLSAAEIQQLSVSFPTPAQSRTIRLENIGAIDSYVNSSIPTTAFGTKPETRTGGSGQENRLLIQFPTIGFPTAVTKATLYFYCKGNNQASAGNAPQNLYLPSTSWINSVTWNTQPAAYLASAVPGTPAAGQWVPIDITSPLSGWLTGNANNGVELRSTGGTNQENAFASLESSVAVERPYLVIEYAHTTGLDVGLIEEFGGTNLNSAVWSGSASVAGGIASIGSEIRTKDSFQIGNATRIELRMRRISSPHVWAGIREISPGTASIDFGDNPYAGGMALAVHGPFGENVIHNSTPTAEWQEYRVTVSGDTAVLSRGSTLNNLTETLTQRYRPQLQDVI